MWSCVLKKVLINKSIIIIIIIINYNFFSSYTIYQWCTVNKKGTCTQKVAEKVTLILAKN